MPVRQIDKFQTETLPPKSSRSVPISPCELLASFKYSNFVPANNAATHMIVEVAAQSRDPQPQPTAKATAPLVGSSSLTMKLRHLRAKAQADKTLPINGSVVRPPGDRDVKVKEATLKPSNLTERRPFESNDAKYLKGNFNKSWNGPDTHSFNVLTGTGGRSADQNNMGKSVSLAIQAKLNVQRRLIGNASADRWFDAHEELIEVVSCQQSIHENSLVDNASGVRTPSISASLHSRHMSRDSSPGHRTSSSNVPGKSKTVCRKKGIESTCDGRNATYSNTKNVVPMKKKYIIHKEHQSDKNCKDDFDLNDECKQRNKSNQLVDSHRKKNIDAVSFSATAPMKGSVSGSKYCNQVPQGSKEDSMCHPCKRALFDSDRRTKLSSSLGLNVNIKDVLSNLLVQKLREVSNGVEFRGIGYLGSDAATSYSSPLQHTLPSINGLRNPSNLYDKLCSDGIGSPLSSDFSSDDALKLRRGHKFEAIDYQCSPVSILEPAFSIESCNSSDSYYSNITEGTLGSNECSSSVQAQEALTLDCLKGIESVEADTELADSASSTPITTLMTDHTHRLGLGVTRSIRSSTTWEVEYVKKILRNLELMFNNLALGRVTAIISPHLYYQTENHKEVSWPMHKVLFDCVGECLDIRCKRYVGGGFESWAKGEIMVKRKARLAEELYKDISAWEIMGDCMVEELVGEDMSNRYGRWAGFEVEAFQIGVEIQERIFLSLVTEVVRDFLQ